MARLLVLLALSGCGDDLLLPSSGEPSLIEVVGGNGQTGTVGQPLSVPLEVEVTDPAGRPVPGVEVVFIAPPGAELTPNDTVRTGSNGRATVNYTLATVSGQQTIEARAKPVVPSTSLTTTFSQTAEPESATGLMMAAGDEQIGDVQTALADSLAVKAVDRFGNGVPGIEVTWEASGGAVSPATVATGADGRAATERTLGGRPGSYPTEASATDLEGSPVKFTATGIAPPSPQIVVVTQPSARAAAGVAFARQPVLQLQDAAGAPLARADVTVTVQVASGGGSLGGATTAKSNDDGVVRFTNLSIHGTPGDRTLIFAASDFTSALSSDIDLRAGPPVASASTASVPATGTAGISTAITVQLVDAFGTPVEGQADDIAVSITGANPASALAITGRGDGSYSASYTPIHAGSDQVDVRVGGTPVGGSPFTSLVAAGPADPSTTTVVFSRSGFFNSTLGVLVTTLDAQGNPLGRGGDLVQVQMSGGELRTAVDQGNGTYTDSFFAGFGAVAVAILVNGIPIAGSPFTT
ncbi:MAG TPA: Ig-like domain-containing protein [Gemmatimonadales bacterium]